MDAHAENAEPGQWGTKGLMARHGASLLCVRYRYDEDTRDHLKTVELIVQRRSRAASRAASPASGSLDRGAESNGSWKPGGWAAVAATGKVALQIGLRERDLQAEVNMRFALADSAEPQVVRCQTLSYSHDHEHGR